MNLVFRKAGKEIKAAITNRRQQLEQRLRQRNKSLDKFLKDTPIGGWLTRPATTSMLRSASH
jgi:hypothetical protein